MGKFVVSVYFVRVDFLIGEGIVVGFYFVVCCIWLGDKFCWVCVG